MQSTQHPRYIAIAIPLPSQRLLEALSPLPAAHQRTWTLARMLTLLLQPPSHHCHLHSLLQTPNLHVPPRPQTIDLRRCSRFRIAGSSMRDRLNECHAEAMSSGCAGTAPAAPPNPSNSNPAARPSSFGSHAGRYGRRAGARRAVAASTDSRRDSRLARPS